MLPHEIQALIAKILFFVFATCLLCLSKVRAGNVANFPQNQKYAASKTSLAKSIKLVQANRKY